MILARLKDKITVITGGARGIKEATTSRLASEGAEVALLDIQHEKAEAAA